MCFHPGITNSFGGTVTERYMANNGSDAFSVSKAIYLTIPTNIKLIIIKSKGIYLTISTNVKVVNYNQKQMANSI